MDTALLLILIGGLVAVGLIAGQWWFMVHLLGQNGRVLARMEELEEEIYEGGAAQSQSGPVATGLPVGSPALEFSLRGLHGETLTLEALRASEKPVVLLFIDHDCAPCTALSPEIRGWQKDHAERLTISLISGGSLVQTRARSTEHGLMGVLVDEEREVAASYEAYATPREQRVLPNGTVYAGSYKTPSAVLVLPDGTIGSPVAGDVEAIRALVTQAAQGGGEEGSPIQLPMLHQGARGGPCPNCGKAHPGAGHDHAPQGLKVGEDAPPIELQDLSEKNVRLEDFRGKKTLVLFWNPGCGFCQQMLPDLKAWEDNPPQGTPELLVVSAGTVEDNKAMNLRSSVVLDQNFEVGRAFGAMGTPAAVLVDEQGKVASEVAVGAPEVFELAGAKAVS